MTMNDLKFLTTALQSANADLSAKQSAITEATRKRDSLAADLAGLDASLEAAEQAHAMSLAAIELGEKADTKATAKALADARLALVGKVEIAQSYRIAAAVVDGLERRHAEAHSKALELAEAHKSAMIAALDTRAALAMDEARELLAGLTASGAKLAGLKGLLAELGHVWQLGSITIHDANLTPAASAVQLFQLQTRAELAA
jgi:hypothetical protein